MAHGTAASRMKISAHTERNSRTRSGSSANVLIADRHRAFREGLRINLRSGFLVLGEAANVAELEELVKVTAADLILVAQDLPGGGLPAAVKIAPPAARIVVFAEKARGDQVIDALQLGVSGYLLKNTSASGLGSALQTVMRGEPAIDHSLVKILVNAITLQAPVRRPRRDGDPPALTPREQQVAVLLGSGGSTHEIAEALGVSDVTVRRHISALMRKLQVVSRDAAREVLGR